MHCLMYHRVGRAATNPWGITVSPEIFEAQIDWLVRNRRVITPDELLAGIGSGTPDPNAVLLTFDDGYADNFLVAKPILEKYRCPASFFIPTAFIGSSSPFWWDELERIFLRSERLPPRLELVTGEHTAFFQIGQPLLCAGDLQKLRSWKWYEAEKTGRGEIFLKIWAWLKKRPFNEIASHMRKISGWAAVVHEEEMPLLMNAAQLSGLAANQLFSIGLHTHTHPDLSELSYEDQYREISEGWEILAKEFQLKPSMLAYPFGNWNPATLAIARNLGLETCFTTEPVAITAGSDRYLLGRFQPTVDSPFSFIAPTCPVT